MIRVTEREKRQIQLVPISRDTNTRMNYQPENAAQILQENSLQTGEFPVLNRIQRKRPGKKCFLQTCHSMWR